MIEQTDGQRFLLDGDGKIIPTGDASNGPLVQAADTGRAEPPQRPGEAGNMRRRAYLIGNHADFGAFLHQAQHGVDEVAADRRIDPGGAHDQRIGAGGNFARQLGGAIGADRIGCGIGTIGLARGAVEDKIGGNMHQPRRMGGEQGNRIGVDALGERGVSFGLVDGGIGGRIENDIGTAVGNDPRHRGGIRDVKIGLGRRDDGDTSGCAGLQGAAKLPAGTGNKRPHANTGASASSGAAASLPESCGVIPASGQSIPIAGSFQRMPRSSLPSYNCVHL
ncbi:MAG: hypothetical protein RL480_2158 [Pseudomonadota bacterium]